MPGAASMPLETSTANGCRAAIASATLVGREAAGEDEVVARAWQASAGSRAQRRPVERAAGAAVGAGRAGVEQHEVGERRVGSVGGGDDERPQAAPRRRRPHGRDRRPVGAGRELHGVAAGVRDAPRRSMSAGSVVTTATVSASPACGGELGGAAAGDDVARALA